MSGTDKKVECGKHGAHPATFVCNHLMQGEGLGFHYGYDPDEPDPLYPDAWCDDCEAVLNAEGEWNRKSETFADIRLLCSKCYVETRARNWKQDDERFAELVRSSVEYLDEKQQAFIEAFGINDCERWDWYQETGTLVFSHEGHRRVEADIDFAGTLSTQSDTWLWAWANTSLAHGIKQQSRDMRALGEQYWYLNLAAAHWPANETDGWEMTAIMAKHLGAMGAYRTPGDHGFTYMIVRQARRVEPGKDSRQAQSG